MAGILTLGSHRKLTASSALSAGVSSLAEEEVDDDTVRSGPTLSRVWARRGTVTAPLVSELVKILECAPLLLLLQLLLAGRGALEVLPRLAFWDSSSTARKTPLLEN